MRGILFIPLYFLLFVALSMACNAVLHNTVSPDVRVLTQCVVPLAIVLALAVRAHRTNANGLHGK